MMYSILFLGLMQARQYNFEVEFVTYKWPSWLRRQREKQRIIWGHKILFLDVLFPLKLGKVLSFLLELDLCALNIC